MKKYIVILVIGMLIIVGSYKCPVYGFLGVPCPSCGMTRAWRLFLSGNIKEAFLMHPLFLVPALLFVPKCQKTKSLWIIAAVFAAVYIIRLFLLFPHTPPMNYNYNSVIGEFLR